MKEKEWTVIHIRKRTKARMDAVKGKDISYDVYLTEIHSRIARKRNGESKLKLWP